MRAHHSSYLKKYDCSVNIKMLTLIRFILYKTYNCEPANKIIRLFLFMMWIKVNNVVDQGFFKPYDLSNNGTKTIPNFITSFIPLNERYIISNRKLP